MQIATRTPAAMMKRSATNEIGGKSASPILIASQVEPQTRQSVSHAPTIAKANPALRGAVDGDDSILRLALSIKIFLDKARSAELKTLDGNDSATLICF